MFPSSSEKSLPEPGLRELSSMPGVTQLSSLQMEIATCLVWAEEPTAHKQETTHNSFWIPINILCFYCLWDSACAWVRTRWGVDKKLSQPGMPHTGNSGESLKMCTFPRQKPASIPTSYSRKLYCSTCTMSPRLWGNMQVLKLGINLLNQLILLALGVGPAWDRSWSSSGGWEVELWPEAVWNILKRL